MNAFDYASLDPETRIVVQQRTGEIKTFMRQTAQGIVEIGNRLIDVKDRLEHGLFLDWLEGEFQWSRTTATRFMNVARSFDGQMLHGATFDARALYLLAAPSTPEPARQQAIQQAAAGERVTVAKAKVIIDQHRPAPAPSTQYPAPSTQPPSDLLPILADWLTVFKTDRQRETALQDAARNGSTYQAALRVRLPMGTSNKAVCAAARTLRGQSIPDVAPVATNGAAVGRPMPAVVRPAPVQPVARDLSLDELRAALLQLLTLPHSASNADILAAVATLQAAYEVSYE